MPNDSAHAHNDQRRKGDNLALALDLADAGIPVFPCRAGGAKAKAPLTENGFLDATTDEMRIRRWWKRYPDAVPGIPTGKPSGIAVLDLDRKNGKDGVAALEAMGLHPEAVVEIRTPKGGWHLIYRHLEGLQSSVDRVGRGIDVRGEGGYIIAPGAVMADGTCYRVDRGDLISDVDRLTGWPADLLPSERERDSEEEDREPAGLSEEEAQAMLEALPAEFGNTRDEWRMVGMGLHHEFGDDAFDMFDEWASKREGYGGYRDQLRQWRSFRSDRAGEVVTIRSTMKAARESGWDRPAVMDSELSDLLDEFDTLTREERDEIREDRRRRKERGKRRAGPVVLTPDQCAADLTRTPSYLIKNLLLNDTVAVIYGQPNAGKSVIAPYLGYRVAQGKPAFCRRVKQAPIIYASFEGAGGITRRVGSLHRQYGPAPDFHLALHLGSLLPVKGKPSQGQRDLEQMVRDFGAKLVFIDTLAAAFPGLDENQMSKEGMGLVLGVANALNALGATVVFVHHPTKTGETMRGSGGLLGAVDLTMRVEKEADGVVTCRSEKTRDTAGDDLLTFSNAVDVIGNDDDGDEITTVYCREVDEWAEPETVDKTLSENDRAALDALRSIVDEDCAARLDEWRELCLVGNDWFRGSTRAARRNSFNRAEERLTAKGIVEVTGNRVRFLEGTEN